MERYIDRLSYYLTVTQEAAYHVQRQTNHDEGRMKQYYDQAMDQWSTHRLKNIPAPQYTEARRQFFAEVDQLCRVKPPAADCEAWYIRGFAAHAAVEAINVQELGYADVSETQAGKINAEVLKKLRRNLNGGEDPELGTGPHTDADREAASRGVNLIGRTWKHRHDQTGISQQSEVVDYGSTLRGGSFYVIETVTFDCEGRAVETAPPKQISEEKLMDNLSNYARN